MDVWEQYQDWCENPYFDEQTRNELIALKGNQEEIKDRFYKELSFGTGGLRGVIGAGSNRMNFYTVRKATQGLAAYILEEGGAQKGVAIAFDSRILSAEFAMEAACCLCANGIRVWIFDSLRPTPELSFAVRRLGCIAGIVITASHNPAKYNGYKVYWEDGAQITSPRDKKISGKINAVGDYAMVKTMPEAEARAAGLLNTIGPEMDSAYIEAVKSLVMEPEALKKQAPELKIVYTPLHGTGNLPVRHVLRELGFGQVYVVPEQEKPDGRFPTVPYPNPEDPKAFSLALALAEKVQADLILATDPDADRLGVYAWDPKARAYIPFTGNMSGMVICEYLLSRRAQRGQLPENGAVVTTIVSGKMAQAAAKAYGVQVIETLTGFKYIGEQIKRFEQEGKYTYLFGYEESYGCLAGTYARDKDAVSAAAALCEAAAYYREQGSSLWEQMKLLYEKYGYYREELATVTQTGADGVEKIRAVMERLRNAPPKKIGGWNVIALRDYANNVVYSFANDSVGHTGLPRENVLYFELEQDAWCCVRPSGTEPKIKFYLGVKGTDFADAQEKAQRLKGAFMELAAIG